MSELVKGKASYHKTLLHDAYIQMTVSPKAGFIRVREINIFSRSGNCQGTLCCVRENEILLKC